MIETERKEVVKKSVEDVPVKGTCDGCGKELTYTDFTPRFSSDNVILHTYDYYRVTTHHYDWGNDSCESYDYHDFCCVECLIKFVDEFWTKRREHKNWDGRYYDTHEMEIEHMERLCEP